MLKKIGKELVEMCFPLKTRLNYYLSCFWFFVFFILFHPLNNFSGVSIVFQVVLSFMVVRLNVIAVRSYNSNYRNVRIGLSIKKKLFRRSYVRDSILYKRFIIKFINLSIFYMLLYGVALGVGMNGMSASVFDVDIEITESLIESFGNVDYDNYLYYVMPFVVVRFMLGLAYIGIGIGQIMGYSDLAIRVMLFLVKIYSVKIMASIVIDSIKIMTRNMRIRGRWKKT